MRNITLMYILKILEIGQDVEVKSILRTKNVFGMNDASINFSLDANIFSRHQMYVYIVIYIYAML